MARWRVVFAILGTSEVLNNWRTWKRRRRRTCSRSFSLSRLPLAQSTSDFVDLVLKMALKELSAMSTVSWRSLGEKEVRSAYLLDGGESADQ